MSFEEFINDWLQRNKGQAAPQSEWFIDKSGNFGMNYIANYKTLKQHLGEIAKGIGVPTPVLGQLNVSPAGLDAGQIDAKTSDYARDRYAVDYAVIDRLSGRWLTDNDRKTRP